MSPAGAGSYRLRFGCLDDFELTSRGAPRARVALPISFDPVAALSPLSPASYRVRPKRSSGPRCIFSQRRDLPRMRVCGKASAGGLGARLPPSSQPCLSPRLLLRSTPFRGFAAGGKIGPPAQSACSYAIQRPCSSARSLCPVSLFWPDGCFGRRPSRLLAFRSSRFLLPAWLPELAAVCPPFVFGLVAVRLPSVGPSVSAAASSGCRLEPSADAVLSARLAARWRVASMQLRCFDTSV